jgi:hypothetical protein
MSYIGTTELKASDIRRFDVTGSTSATHTLTWTAPTEQSLVVTINGVKQQEDAYSVSGTTLTLTSALVATDKLEVIGINDIGTTITPAQGSVNADKLNTSGTASSSTFLRGDMAWTAVSDVSGLSSVQVFTSSGTWTRPSDITKVIMYVTGGGGGGAGANPGVNDASNGSSSGTAIKLLDVSSISTSTITVGAAGAGGAGGATSSGTVGGLSSWADGTNTIAASGGGKGNYGDGNIGDATTNPTGGDINIPGATGGSTSTGGRMGSSGASFWGGGGVPSQVSNGTTGFGYGSGGGAGGGGASYDNGGAGAGGIIVVWEYK